MIFDIEWKAWFENIVIFAAKNPGTFLYYIFLGLSPLFLISAILSWKLAKHLEHQEREKKRKAKREANIAKAQRTGSKSVKKD